MRTASPLNAAIDKFEEKELQILIHYGQPPKAVVVSMPISRRPAEDGGFRAAPRRISTPFSPTSRRRLQALYSFQQRPCVGGCQAHWEGKCVVVVVVVVVVVFLGFQ